MKRQSTKMEKNKTLNSILQETNELDFLVENIGSLAGFYDSMEHPQVIRMREQYGKRKREIMNGM